MKTEKDYLLVENPGKSFCSSMNRFYNVMLSRYKNIVPVVQNKRLLPIVKDPARNLIMRLDAHFSPSLNIEEFLFNLNPKKIIFFCTDNTVGLEREDRIKGFLKEKGFYLITGFPKSEMPKCQLYDYMIKEFVCDSNAFGKLGTKNNLRNIKVKDINYAYWGAPKVRRKNLLDKYITKDCAIFTSSKKWERKTTLPPLDFSSVSRATGIKNTVYLEDKETNFFSTRFYESLLNGIKPFFPIECQETLRRVGFGGLENMVVESPEEIIFKGESVHFDFGKYIEFEKTNIKNTLEIFENILKE